MNVNKVTLTINSRQYTVVAEESKEYIEKLCGHINEKVEKVRHEGQNILGERPVVLAALNICDEYYKSLEENELVKEELHSCEDKNVKLRRAVQSLRTEVEEASSNQVSIDETTVKAEAAAAKNELSEANSKIKFLEGHITSLEKKLKELNDKYERREKEFLEMIEEG